MSLHDCSQDCSQDLSILAGGSISITPLDGPNEFWAVAVYGNHDNVFFIRHPKKLPKYWFKHLADLHGERIPLDQVYPAFVPNEFTIAPYPLPENTFVKPPQYMRYAHEEYRDHRISATLRGEAKVYEALKKFPHPNIAQYFGCIVRNNRIVGLCIKKYKVQLDDLIQKNKHQVDKEKCLREVKAGIDHLHRVGYSHNDISPYNIMFDEEGTAIIVDFDSSRPLKHELGFKSGTEGFYREGTTHAEAGNDLHAFEKLKEYLNERE